MGFSSQVGQVIFRTQAIQGVYQADTATAGVTARLRTGSLGPARELIIPDPEIGGGRDVSDAYLGAVSWSGDYEFYARYQLLPTLLQATLGESSSAVTTGVVTDTITGRDTSTPRYMSIEETVSDMDTFRYTDAVANTFHLEAEPSGYLMGTIGLIAAVQSAGNAKSTPAATQQDNTPLTVGTNITLTYNAVTLPAKSFSFDITNNFEDDDFRLGSFFLGDLTPKRREVMASFGIRHSSSALWRQAVYGTSAATTPGGVTTKNQLVINCATYEDIPGGTPVTKHSLSLTIPKFMIAPFALEASGDDIMENDIEGQGLRPDVATPIVTAVIKRGGTTADIA